MPNFKCVCFLLFFRKGAGFGSTAKSAFLSSPFGYYQPIPPPLMLPPPPLPPLNADSYSMPFSSTRPGSLPYNREYTQLPNANRYFSNRECPPNIFYPSMSDFLYPSYTEIIPFSDSIGIGYPMLPGRFFTYVEQYNFPNPPSIFNNGIESKVQEFVRDFPSRPRFEKAQPEIFEQQVFGTLPEFSPDLQFCRYSGCGDSAKCCENSAANGFNAFVSYSETVNVLSYPSLTASPESKTENLVEQSADGCVLISQSKVCSNQVSSLLFIFVILY